MRNNCVDFTWKQTQDSAEDFPFARLIDLIISCDNEISARDAYLVIGLHEHIL